MKKIMSILSLIFDRTLDISFILASILIIFVMFFVSGEIISRTFLGNSIYGVVDFTEIALLFITFIGAAWVLKREKHVKVGFVIDRLPPRTQVIFNMMTSIIAACVCLTLTVISTQSAWDTYLRGVTMYNATMLPRAPFMAIIPIGSLLLFIQLLRNTYTCWQKLENPEKGADKF